MQKIGFLQTAQAVFVCVAATSVVRNKMVGRSEFGFIGKTRPYKDCSPAYYLDGIGKVRLTLAGERMRELSRYPTNRT